MLHRVSDIRCKVVFESQQMIWWLFAKVQLHDQVLEHITCSCSGIRCRLLGYTHSYMNPIPREHPKKRSKRGRPLCYLAYQWISKNNAFLFILNFIIIASASYNTVYKGSILLDIRRWCCSLLINGNVRVHHCCFRNQPPILESWFQSLVKPEWFILVYESNGSFGLETPLSRTVHKTTRCVVSNQG